MCACDRDTERERERNQNVFHIKFNGFLIIVQIYSWTEFIVFHLFAGQTKWQTPKRRNKLHKLMIKSVKNYFFFIHRRRRRCVMFNDKLLLFDGAQQQWKVKSKKRNQQNVIIFSPAASAAWMKIFTENHLFLFFFCSDFSIIINQKNGNIRFVRFPK